MEGRDVEARGIIPNLDHRRVDPDEGIRVSVESVRRTAEGYEVVARLGGRAAEAVRGRAVDGMSIQLGKGVPTPEPVKLGDVIAELFGAKISEGDEPVVYRPNRAERRAAARRRRRR